MFLDTPGLDSTKQLLDILIPALAGIEHHANPADAMVNVYNQIAVTHAKETGEEL